MTAETTKRLIPFRPTQPLTRAYVHWFVARFGIDLTPSIIERELGVRALADFMHSLQRGRCCWCELLTDLHPDDLAAGIAQGLYSHNDAEQGFTRCDSPAGPTNDISWGERPLWCETHEPLAWKAAFSEEDSSQAVDLEAWWLWWSRLAPDEQALAMTMCGASLPTQVYEELDGARTGAELGGPYLAWDVSEKMRELAATEAEHPTVTALPPGRLATEMRKLTPLVLEGLLELLELKLKKEQSDASPQA